MIISREQIHIIRQNLAEPGIVGRLNVGPREIEHLQADIRMTSQLLPPWREVLDRMRIKNGDLLQHHVARFPINSVATERRQQRVSAPLWPSQVSTAIGQRSC